MYRCRTPIEGVQHTHQSFSETWAESQHKHKMGLFRGLVLFCERDSQLQVGLMHGMHLHEFLRTFQRNIFVLWVTITHPTITLVFQACRGGGWGGADTVLPQLLPQEASRESWADPLPTGQEPCCLRIQALQFSTDERKTSSLGDLQLAGELGIQSKLGNQANTRVPRLLPGMPFVPFLFGHLIYP